LTKTQLSDEALAPCRPDDGARAGIVYPSSAAVSDMEDAMLGEEETVLGKEDT
jgi:hypothetical protein